MSTLTERYVHAVVRRLPEGMREDVAADVTAMIADMLEARACDEPTPTEAGTAAPHAADPTEPAPSDIAAGDAAAADPASEAAVLEELGSPVALAQEYARTPQHLIGPDVFPAYRAALTWLLPIAVVAALITNGIVYALTEPAAHVGGLIGTAIGRSVPALLIAFSVVTVLFAVFERVGVPSPASSATGSSPIAAGGRGTGRRRWTISDLEELPTAGGSVRWNGVASLIVLVLLAAVPLLPTTLFYVSHLNDGETFVNPSLGAGWLFGYWALLVLMAVEPLTHVVRDRTGRATRVWGIAVDLLMASFLTLALLTQPVLHPDLVAASGTGIAVWLIPVIWAITLWDQVVTVRAHRSSLRTMPARPAAQ